LKVRLVFSTSQTAVAFGIKGLSIDQLLKAGGGVRANAGA
jgi:hypothetical protein